MQHRSRRIAVLVGVAALVAAGGWFALRSTSARSDIAARRSMYRVLPVFPGAVNIGEESYEIKSDSGGTGEYGLRLVYRIPASATSADVISFLESNVPVGWSAASDDLCARLSALSSPSPMAGTVPAMTKLMDRRSAVTVFQDGRDGLSGGSVSGVTLRLSGSGQQKSLTLDEPQYGCQQANHPHDDVAADLFDAG